MTPPDVTFPLGPTGLNNRVKVRVFRTTERGNPVGTLMGRFFGVTNVNIRREATAEASPANAMTCVKPFTIPDKWIEKQTPPWDVDDTFEIVRQPQQPAARPRRVHPGRTRRATPATTPSATRAWS